MPHGGHCSQLRKGRPDGALANVSIAALRWAGVEPCEIRLLHKASGEVIPGCDVLLYGANYLFTVRMEPLKERCSLYGLPLDSKLSGPGVELYKHQFEGTDFVGATLAVILRREDVDIFSRPEYLGQEDSDY